MTAEHAHAEGDKAGTTASLGVLDEILAGVRADVARRQEQVPLERIRELAAAAPPPLDAYAALRRPGVAVIAEVKRAVAVEGQVGRDRRPGGVGR